MKIRYADKPKAQTKDAACIEFGTVFTGYIDNYQKEYGRLTLLRGPYALIDLSNPSSFFMLGGGELRITDYKELDVELVVKGEQ